MAAAGGAGGPPPRPSSTVRFSDSVRVRPNGNFGVPSLIPNSTHPLVTAAPHKPKKASKPLVPQGMASSEYDAKVYHPAINALLEASMLRRGPYFKTPETAHEKGETVYSGSLYVPALKGPKGKPFNAVRITETPEEVAATAAAAAAAAEIVGKERVDRQFATFPSEKKRKGALNLNAMAAAENRGEVSGVATFRIAPREAGGASALKEWGKGITTFRIAPREAGGDSKLPRILSSPIYNNYFASNISQFAFFQIGKFYLTGDPAIKVKIISKGDNINRDNEGDVVLLLKDATVEFYNNNVLQRQARVMLGIGIIPGQSERYIIFEGNLDEERPNGNFTGITEITMPASGGRRTRKHKRMKKRQMHRFTVYK